MRRSISYRYLGFLLLMLVAHSTGTAATFFFEIEQQLSVGTRTYVTYRSAPTKEEAVKRLKGELDSGDSIIGMKFSCLNQGWAVLITGYQTNVQSHRTIRQDSAGACGYPTKDAALKAAVISCLKKHPCRAIARGDSNFGYVVWNDNGTKLSKTDFTSCGVRQSDEASKSNCGRDQGVHSHSGPEWPFDKDEFLEKYGQ